MTVHTHCPGGCGQPLLWPTDNPELCAHCATYQHDASYHDEVATFAAFDTSDVTFTSVDLYDAPGGGRHHGTVLFNQDGTKEFIPPSPTPPTLYGKVDDDELQLDLDEALEHEVDAHTWDGATVYPGYSWEIEICEFSTFPKGLSPTTSIPDGARLAEHIVERFWEDCAFEGAYEDLWEATKDREVIVAFQAARDLLVSKQQYLLADQVITTHRYKITIRDEHGNWDLELIQ